MPSPGTEECTWPGSLLSLRDLGGRAGLCHLSCTLEKEGRSFVRSKERVRGLRCGSVFWSVSRFMRNVLKNLWEARFKEPGIYSWDTGQP